MILVSLLDAFVLASEVPVDDDTGEPSEASFPCNLETSVYIQVVLILFFFAKYVCSHEMISMSNG